LKKLLLGLSLLEIGGSGTIVQKDARETLSFAADVIPVCEYFLSLGFTMCIKFKIKISEFLSRMFCFLETLFLGDF